MEFRHDYNYFAEVLDNRKPVRLPLYEHQINDTFMAKATGRRIAELLRGDDSDISEYFKEYCGFFRDMTYDTVSFETCITEILPGPGAICGGKGPIQNRSDLESYPWEEIPALFEKKAYPRYQALSAVMPTGMKAVGGVGNGVFEISEDLVGLEYLPFMQSDDPDLYAELYRRIGDMMVTIWQSFLDRFADTYVVCRIGDDMGFKASLLTNPRTIRDHVVPQYRRVIDLIHSRGKRFLWHSCGCIFEVMEDLIAAGIDGKHSNEDTIAPFDRWIEEYGDRIALLGGFDLDFICQQDEQCVYRGCLDNGRRFRNRDAGYAMGSGNSIPDYVPVENYLAMIRAAQDLRREELL